MASKAIFSSILTCRSETVSKLYEKCQTLEMFLVTEEQLRKYPPPLQILFLAIALCAVIVLFYYSFWEYFYKVIFTDEPRVGADYPAFALAICNIIVIITTIFRLLRHSADELKRRLK